MGSVSVGKWSWLKRVTSAVSAALPEPGLGGHGWKQLRVLRGGCLAFLGYEGLSVFRVTWLTAPLQLQLALYNLLASAFRLCANFTNISTMETAAIKCLFPDPALWGWREIQGNNSTVGLSSENNHLSVSVWGHEVSGFSGFTCVCACVHVCTCVYVHACDLWISRFFCKDSGKQFLYYQTLFMDDEEEPV